MSPRIHVFRAGCMVLIMLAASCPDAAAQEPVRIASRERLTNFFADAEIRLNLQVSAGKAVKGKVLWRLSASNRTLVSREVAVDVQPDKPATVAIRHKPPTVKEGVIFPLQLRATVIANGADAPLGPFDETLYLFARNPFSDRHEWLKSLEIQLFDPDESTAKALDVLEVPYARLTNLETLPDLAQGVLVVGEGLSWNDYGDLGKTLLTAASRGVTVICLAPAAAEFALPLATSEDAAIATAISLRRREFIRELDKRLALVWNSDRPVEARELAIVAEKESVLARAVEPGRGWPWVEVRYARPGGRLLWCGLGLIRSWDESPTPRYLFARILESLSEEQAKSQTAVDSTLNKEK